MLGYTPTMDGAPEHEPGPAPPVVDAVHHVYIVRCADGSLYTGYAVDIARRVDAHNAGRGARYTAGRRPVGSVFRESFATARRGPEPRAPDQAAAHARRKTR